jgi:DNA-directed RNA polymerase subunit RPC12/RpoP
MSDEGSVKNDQRKPIDKQKLMFAIIYLGLVVVAAILLLPDYWYLFAIIAIIAAYRIVLMYRKRTVYKCNKCGNLFSHAKRSTLRPQPSDLYDDTKEIRCPRCKSTSVAKLSKR